jgi:hypothetical protein
LGQSYTSENIVIYAALLPHDAKPVMGKPLLGGILASTGCRSS